MTDIFVRVSCNLFGDMVYVLCMYPVSTFLLATWCIVCWCCVIPATINNCCLCTAVRRYCNLACVCMNLVSGDHRVRPQGRLADREKEF